MTRPLLLDLFCCEGGAAMGYHRAGFDVVGVDHIKRPAYPFPMVIADALRPPFDLSRFAAIHASPPCQRYSAATKSKGNPEDHPDLYAPTKALLKSAGVPYLIENVDGSPVRPDVVVCGSMFGMEVRRHRVFELGGWFMLQPGCSGHDGPTYDVTGGMATRSGVRSDGRPDRKARSAAHKRELMGMPWATAYGCNQAIPPAYTEWLGRELIGQVR